jgi:hypothetical protein
VRTSIRLIFSCFSQVGEDGPFCDQPINGKVTIGNQHSMMEPNKGMGQIPHANAPMLTVPALMMIERRISQSEKRRCI